MDQENRMPLIGDKAPSFEAVNTRSSVNSRRITPANG